jgi:hypothetical protein
MPRNSHLLTNNPDRFIPRDIKQPRVFRVFSSNRRPYSEYRQRTDYLDYKTFHVHKMEEDTYVHPGNLFLPSFLFFVAILEGSWKEMDCKVKLSILFRGSGNYLTVESLLASFRWQLHFRTSF